jgi:hypothetical protein
MRRDVLGLLALSSPKRQAMCSTSDPASQASDGSEPRDRLGTRHTTMVKIAQHSGTIPELWARLSTLSPTAPAPPPPAGPGDLVSLHNWPGRAELEGLGAEVRGITEGGELELTLEGAKPGTPAVCVDARCTTTLPAYPTDGVSLAFLRAFRSAHAAELEGKTTSEVCKQIVSPVTQRPQASLAASLRRVGAADPQTNQPYAARATLFVSHAWRYQHTELLDAIHAHADGLPNPESVYVWLDLFSVNHHENTEAPMIWWTEMYARAIGSMDAACLVLSPWHEPLPLRRAWCVWEAAAIEATRKPLHITMPPSEAAACRRALADDFEAVEALLWSIDVNLAQTHEPSERELILRLIEQRVGVASLTTSLQRRMREWMVQAGQEALREAQATDEEAHALLGNVARLLQDLGRSGEAEVLLRRTVAARLRKLGAQHPLTLLAQAHLVDVLVARGSHEEARALLRPTLRGLMGLLGPADAAVLELQAVGTLVGLEAARLRSTLGMTSHRAGMPSQQPWRG